MIEGNLRPSGDESAEPPNGIWVSGGQIALCYDFELKDLDAMNSLTNKYITAFAAAAMTFMLVGCQQAPPPTTVVNTPPATSSTPEPSTSTTEHTTTSNTETKQTTPAPVNPDGTASAVDSQTTATQKTTTVEKKK